MGKGRRSAQWRRGDKGNGARRENGWSTGCPLLAGWTNGRNTGLYGNGDDSGGRDDSGKVGHDENVGDESVNPFTIKGRIIFHRGCRHLVAVRDHKVKTMILCDKKGECCVAKLYHIPDYICSMILYTAATDECQHHEDVQYQIC